MNKLIRAGAHLRFLVFILLVFLCTAQPMSAGRDTSQPATLPRLPSPRQSNSPTRNAQPPAAPQALQPIVVISSRHDLSPVLSGLSGQPTIPSALRQKDDLELPGFPLWKAVKAAGGMRAAPRDGLVQDQFLSPMEMPAPLQSFDGVGNLFGGWPPDTQGDIGKNHYVQWINDHFAIWLIDKVNNSAGLVYGPVPGNTLSQGFGGACESTNDGDPITLYDPLAERWFMSQFALPYFPYGPFYQCIAVSQTDDPTGAWYRYEFQMPVDKMNDYPKFGVWPGAYFMTVNQFQSGSLNWAGAGVAALERDAMLAGDPARMIYFDLYDIDYRYGGMLPADYDGLNLPPAGAPGYFAEWDDGAMIEPEDALRVWEFFVNWTDPAASTFGLTGNPNQVIPTGDVDPDLCGFSRYCIPQPDTSTRVDAISDRLMHRLQYRNFGGYETLVANHTVDVDATDHAGIHWFEIRKGSGGWSLYQEGVYAPDADHRWMGSIAMDHVGDIALGFSVSSSSTYPSVRYTGRLNGDPPGLLPQGEQSLVAGSGSQTGSSRWGDYSMMGVDPIDDCTFWYTQEYVQTTGSNSWKTRIGSFRFPSCTTGPRGTLQGQVFDNATSAGISGAQVSATLSLTYTLSTQTQPDGDYALVMPVGTYTTTASAYGYFSETITGVEVYSGTVTTQDFSLDLAPHYTVSGVVRDAGGGWPLYARVAVAGVPIEPVWSDPVTGQYSLSLPAGFVFSFNVEAFVPGYKVTSLTVGPLTGNLAQDILLEADQEACNAPGYAFTPVVFSTDFEDDPGGFSASGSTSWAWGVPTSGPGAAYSGQNAWATNLGGYYSNNEDGFLTSSPIDMSALGGQKLILRWWQWLQTEAGYDYGLVQASPDGGNTWTTVYGPDTGYADSTWAEHFLFLDPSFAVSNLLIRFYFHSDYSITGPGWYIDDVAIGAANCNQQAGGLVVGNVLDANTSLGLVGATISNETGLSTASLATPLDAAVGDGFYTLFSPQGTQVFTATMEGGYLADVESRIVPLNGTARQDFHLEAGLLQTDPPSFDVSLELGTSTTLPLVMDNQGGAPASFKLIELENWWSFQGVIQQPAYVIRSFRQNFRTSQGLPIPEQPPARRLEAGQVLQSWTPAGAPGPWGIAYSGWDETVWVSSPASTWGGNDRVHEFDLSGQPTGRSQAFAFSHLYGPADLAYNWNTGMLWAMSVGEPGNCIYEIDPWDGYTGNMICPGGGTGFQISQRGLAFDPLNDYWFAGGWNDGMIYQFDGEGNIVASVNTGLAISGLAFNPDTQHLFVMVNGETTAIYVLDLSSNLSIIGQFSPSQGFGSYAGAGLEIDCQGNLWAVDQQAGLVYQLESGESANLCEFDIPWLSTEPVSGTLPALTSLPVQVTFDARIAEIDQPGIFRAQMKILENTPYPAANIPIRMRVEAPSSWGKLYGTVSGLGYCDEDPTGLGFAQVVIESSTGVTFTVEADFTGYYQRWLDGAGSPYTVTVTAADHLPGLASDVLVAGGGDTELDFGLPWLRPCIRANPNSLAVELKQGLTRTLPMTLTNSGYATTEFSLNNPEILIREGFESGVMPPPGWSQLITNDSATWETSYSWPNSGFYHGRVPLGNNQDEWLLSPEVNLVQGILSFWSLGSVYLCRDMLDNCDLNVWLVVGNVGGGDDIFVGTADDDWVDDGGYSQSVFDLTPLLPAAAPGVPVRIGFQYHGNDGFDIYIDDILLDSLATADITWLSATPITGTLTSLGGEQVIQVAFDANVVEAYQPGDYAAQLKVVSDDPVNGILSIPVTMTVLALEYGVDLSGDLTGQDIPGETVKYTLTVTNTSEGPSDSFAITFGPHNWFSSSPAGVIGPLEQGESAQFQVEVRIPASAAGGDQEELLVTATSVADPGKTDTATLTTRVESPLADLELDGSVSSSTVWAGVPVTYTLVVTNRGPTKAPHVVLTDVLPAGAVYAWDDGGCSVMGGVLSCELGSMPVRGVRSIEVVIWPLSLRLMVNQAFITAEADDPDRSNNWSTLWTVVEGYLFYFPIMFR